MLVDKGERRRSVVRLEDVQSGVEKSFSLRVPLAKAQTATSGLGFMSTALSEVSSPAAGYRVEQIQPALLIYPGLKHNTEA